ncbi:uncharacterized protein F5147DRAFT_652938 [Suillus discolor]|uniref:Uncharacterized protein n=1 Tax=Suillus discolor TaxID=1912936 RepID=A0A9P7JTZ5_9AGAM|nr:uncharacterized protein F5147DRAFT_652938 [Suillus discolor]KAG2108216.1 hypothetical protein F5147DRAFT_652938 [Suillus discolor]
MSCMRAWKLNFLNHGPTSDQSEKASGLNNHQKELCIKQYKELVKLVPTFSDIISGFKNILSALDNFIHALTCTANDVRSDDTGSLMNPKTNRFNPPLLRQHDKITCGWNHPQAARLLCLIWMLDVFNKNLQDFMDKVKEGKIKVVFEDTTSNMSFTTYSLDNRVLFLQLLTKAQRLQKVKFMPYRENPGLLQHGRSRARIDAGLHAFESKDDMDSFFESNERFPDNGEQGPQDRTKNSGNAENTYANVHSALVVSDDNKSYQLTTPSLHLYWLVPNILLTNMMTCTKLVRCMGD